MNVVYYGTNKQIICFERWAMAEKISVSTDQVAAFVALSRHGSLRRAAEELNITEQGLRSRLLVLEQRLGVELYRKTQGPRRASPLTERGRQLLPHAAAFLERAEDLISFFDEAGRVQEIKIAASQYLTTYLLIDAVARFRQKYPNIHLRLSSRTSRQVEQSLLEDLDLAFGVITPYDPSPRLEYTHLMSVDWGFIAPPGHPLLRRRKLRLRDLSGETVILYEHGSAGRRQLIAAFNREGVTPRVGAETTNTEVIIRMVEAGMGVSLIPLLAGGAVTRGRRIGVRTISDQLTPLEVGLLTRKGEKPSAVGEAFIAFLRS